MSKQRMPAHVVREVHARSEGVCEAMIRGCVGGVVSICTTGSCVPKGASTRPKTLSTSVLVAMTTFTATRAGRMSKDCW